MKNNKGIGKFEGLTIIVLLICIVAYLMYNTLGGVSTRKIQSFKDNASSFHKVVYTNIDSFHNERVVYLEEVIDEKFLDKIKSPFSSSNCDATESKVETDGNKRLVTLKCNQYLINQARATDLESATIYEVGDWSSDVLEGEDIEEKTLYNCSENEELVFDSYMEEYYFVYKINQKYGQNHYSKDSITSCNVVSKVFYRTIKKVE